MAHLLQRAQARNFDELKQNAYDAAVIGSGQNWNEVWQQNYLDRYAPVLHRKLWQDTIDLYVRYIKGEISVDEAKVSIQRIEEEFVDENEISELQNLHKFAIAITKAFEEVNEDILSVKFICPLCNGHAYGNRVAKSGSRNGFRARRAKCDNCGYTVMT